LYIQQQIDEQISILQCITKEPISSISRVINKRYPEWLDGKWPDDDDSSETTKL